MDQSSPPTPSSVCAPTTRLRIALIGATLAVLGLFVGSFAVGTYPIAATTVVAVFLHRLHLVEKTWSDAIELVILNIRWPRIAAALLVGWRARRGARDLRHALRRRRCLGELFSHPNELRTLSRKTPSHAHRHIPTRQ